MFPRGILYLIAYLKSLSVNFHEKRNSWQQELIPKPFGHVATVLLTRPPGQRHKNQSQTAMT